MSTWSSHPSAEPARYGVGWWPRGHEPIDEPQPPETGWFPRSNRSGKLSAEGTLVVDARLRYAQAAQFAAEAAVEVELTNQIHAAPAALSAQGTLGVGASARYAQGAALSATGTLAAAVMARYTQAAQLAAEGQLSAVALARYARAAQLAAEGQLSVSALQRFARTAPLSTEATLATAVTNQIHTGPVGFAATGTLASTVLTRYLQDAGFTTTGTLACAAAFPAMAPASATFTTVGAYSYTIPYWCRYIDIVLIGGGGGGQGGQGTGIAGCGGYGASWYGVTWERGVDIPWNIATITGLIGDGGAGGPSNPAFNQPGVDGAPSSATFAGGGTISAAGGLKGDAVINGQNGKSPGNFTWNGIPYTGGAQVTSGTAAPGNPPGGGGRGGNLGAFGIGQSAGGKGARGQVWFRAFQ